MQLLDLEFFVLLPLCVKVGFLEVIPLVVIVVSILLLVVRCIVISSSCREPLPSFIIVEPTLHVSEIVELPPDRVLQCLISLNDLFECFLFFSYY
jgi:hypothetical protein